MQNNVSPLYSLGSAFAALWLVSCGSGEVTSISDSGLEEKTIDFSSLVSNPENLQQWDAKYSATSSLPSSGALSSSSDQSSSSSSAVTLSSSATSSAGGASSSSSTSSSSSPQGSSSSPAGAKLSAICTKNPNSELVQSGTEVTWSINATGGIGTATYLWDDQSTAITNKRTITSKVTPQVIVQKGDTLTVTCPSVDIQPLTATCKSDKSGPVAIGESVTWTVTASGGAGDITHLWTDGTTLDKWTAQLSSDITPTVQVKRGSSEVSPQCNPVKIIPPPTTCSPGTLCTIQHGGNSKYLFPTGNGYVLTPANEYSGHLFCWGDGDNVRVTLTKPAQSEIKLRSTPQGESDDTKILENFTNQKNEEVIMNVVGGTATCIAHW